jgi:chromosome partitioning protein
MARVIAICNQKGGTGKTTTAINLSSFLAKTNKKVLLIDIDPQGNTTSGLGINKASLSNSIYHAMLNHIELNAVISVSGIAGLSLVPSTVDLAGAEIELVNAPNRENRLRLSLAPLREQFDFIFIDCPPSLGILTLNALVCADAVLIPIQCEYYALEGVTQLLKTIELVKDNLNPQLKIEGVLLTMADYRTNLTNEVINEIKNFFKDKVYQTIIPRNIRLSEAPGFGKPIMLYDAQSIGARMYEELAKEVLGEEPAATAINPGGDK